MKTKLLFIALTFTLMLSGCSKDEQTNQNNCDCEKQYYIGAPIVGGGGFQYTFQFSEQIQYDCEGETGVYIPVSNVNYNYYKIECD